MSRLSQGARVGALLVCCAAFGGAAVSAAEGPVRIPLDAMNGSGETGVAILTPRASGRRSSCR